jgi:co-chaperonin GroES (HSP10)
MEPEEFNTAELDKEIMKEKESTVKFDGGNAVELVGLGIVLEATEDKIIVKLDDYKTGYECANCNETGKIASNKKDEDFIECPVCRGKGVTLVVPDSAKHLPTSGIILSVGPMTKNKIRERALVSSAFPINEIDYPENKIQLGQRVIFTAHVGTLIPFKGNIKLKVMREHEVLCIMYGADTGAKSFMELDTDFRES